MFGSVTFAWYKEDFDYKKFRYPVGCEFRQIRYKRYYMKKGIYYIVQKALFASRREDSPFRLIDIQSLSLAKITFSSAILPTSSFSMRMCCCGTSRWFPTIPLFSLLFLVIKIETRWFPNFIHTDFNRFFRLSGLNGESEHLLVPMLSDLTF